MANFLGYDKIDDNTYKDLAIIGHSLIDQSTTSYEYARAGTTTTTSVRVLGDNFDYANNSVVSGSPTFIIGLNDENPSFEFRFYGFTINDLSGLTAPQQVEKIFGGSDYLRGNTFLATNDKLQGFAGNDVIEGGLGVDRMYGGTGNDTFYVAQRGDKAFEKAGEGTDLVVASISYSLVGQFVENLKFTGSGDIDAVGNSLSNTITGNSGDNFLRGGAGGDRLIGGGGNDDLIGGSGIDRLSGGTGNDFYVVDNKGDNVVESANAGIDTVQTNMTYKLTSNVENLMMTGSANTTGTGNLLGNTISGNAGNNFINGGLGQDVLKGAFGNDTFIFDTKLGESNVDHIVDYSVAHDTIRLENAIFSKLKSGELSNENFKDVTSSSTVIDSDDHIFYNHATGVVSYDADGSGSAKAVAFVVIDTHPSLTYHDFFVA